MTDKDRLVIQRELAAASLRVVRVLLARYGIGAKRYSIKAVIDDYASELQAGADNKDNDKEKLIALILLLLAKYSKQAYEEGYRSGGGTGDIGIEGETIVAEFIAAQSLFADGLAQAIIDARNADSATADTAQADITARIAFWAATLDVLRMKGLAAADDPMVTWRYGDTDHCDTCLNLNGTRRRLSWFLERGYIPREPASNTLDCKGYNCKCGLYDDNGNQVM